MSIAEYRLRLYIAGQRHISKLALSHIQTICNEHPQEYSLDVIDLEQRPELAHLDGIVTIPTLVRWFPQPRKIITGALNPEATTTSLAAGIEAETAASHRVVLHEIVKATMQNLCADMGTLRILDPRSGLARIEAQIGFRPDFLDFFTYVRCGQSACGAALRDRRRVIVEDVTLSPVLFGPESLSVMLDAGVRSIMATPMVGRLGDPVGVLSAYWRTPTLPLERDKFRLNELARWAGRYLERLQQPAIRRQS